MRWPILLTLALAVACGSSDAEVDDDDDDDDLLGGGSGGGEGGGEGGGDGGGGGGSDYDTSLIIGGTWRIQLDEANWVEPAGVGGLIGMFLEYDFLLGVTDASSTTVDTLMALGLKDENQQDFCQVTLEMEGDFSEGPHFSIGPDDLSIPYGDGALVMHDFALSGTFSDDGSEVADGELMGTLDMRDLAVALGDALGTDDPYEICELVAGFGVSCLACTDGEELCIDLQLDTIVAERQDFTLEVVTEAGSHPDCTE